MTAGAACVDSSVVVKTLIPEPGTDRVKTLWHEWTRNNIQLFAPAHMPFEVGSALRRRVAEGLLQERHGGEALKELFQLNIELVSSPEVLRNAWTLAKRFHWATLYDAAFLAVAELHRCPLWTADQRLFLRVRRDLPWVKLLETSQPT